MYAPIPEVQQDQQEPLSRDQQEQSSPRFEETRSSTGSFLWRAFGLSFAAACVLFGFYMCFFYLRSMVERKLSAWDLANPGMYHKDRWDSNWLGLGLHFVGGTYMMLFGPLQFVPAIRRNWMTFHRWNGRLTALGSIFTALGGIYYILAVGMSTVWLIGRQANWTTLGFGLAMLICGFQTYRHAAWTKKIDQHKLWAYRTAGVCFGNIFARMYLLVLFLVMGDQLLEAKFAIQILGYIFYLPFILLAGEMWKREQHEKGVPSIAFITVAALLLVLFVLLTLLVFLWTWLPFVTMSLDQDSNKDL